MSRLSRLIYDVRTAEQEDERAVGKHGEVQVPWQVYTVDGRRLTVHYYTNAHNEFVGVRSAESGEEVRITVLERRVSDKLPGQQRAQTLTLSTPLADRRVIDGATGRRREPFVPDPDAAWSAFEVAAAEWLLCGDRLMVLERAAHNALEDGCQSVALERIAAGDRDLSEVYRERGRTVPDRRAAAKIAVDAALATAFDEQPSAESIGFTLDAIARSGRIHPDQREQLAGLLGIYRDIRNARHTTDYPKDEMDRLLAAAREMHARGGLRP